MIFHSIPVAETSSLLEGGAKTICFELPAELRDAFAWQAGQHLTLRFTLGGEEVRRSYTISSSPTSGDPLRITVKRVEGGLVSNHINDHLEKGMSVDLHPPNGNFSLIPGASERRTHYFLGAGSGITPLYSMLHTVLCSEPYSVVHLLYANRNDQSILFFEELARLQELYPDRISVTHVFSSPRILSSFKYWKSGRIDVACVEQWILKYPPYAQDCQYYLCGPGSMNNALRDILQRLDVPAGRIHSESFGGGDHQSGSEILGCASQARVTLDGVTSHIELAEGETLLDAARAAGLKPPFSCQSGICGVCQAKLVSGEVGMKSCAALSEEDIKQGQILTCQALATSDELVVEYPS